MGPDTRVIGLCGFVRSFDFKGLCDVGNEIRADCDMKCDEESISKWVVKLLGGRNGKLGCNGLPASALGTT